MVRRPSSRSSTNRLPEQGHKLSVSGELDLATTPQLEQQVSTLLTDGARSIVIDLLTSTSSTPPACACCCC
jgi:anti-anti-sigma regulatory factor